MEIFHAEGFLYREKCGKRTVEIREKGEESAVSPGERKGKGKKKGVVDDEEKRGNSAWEKERVERGGKGKTVRK